MDAQTNTVMMKALTFTPFRVENAQSNCSIPFISSPKRGILNEKWCKNIKYNKNIENQIIRIYQLL